MPFTHHSHSGEFCMHAKDTLEDIILAAIGKGMRILALTEHMPRDQPEDLYPEEVDANVSNFDLFRTFADYYEKARSLREKYQHAIHILIGFEVDYIRASSIPLINRLQADYNFDLFLGSVHHVNTIPIDFDAKMYAEARQTCGNGTDRDLFDAYFDAQWEMITLLQPPIVGHFDLIRLLSDSPSARLDTWDPEDEGGKILWDKIVRNVKAVVSYGGFIELNSASLRKGWDEAYPRRDICELVQSLGGRFTFSDDSHGVSQVGLNYDKLLQYARSLNIQEIYYLERLPMGQLAIDCLGPCKIRTIALTELENDPFYVNFQRPE
ncbi:polymerase/histidinol phosphatase-like protein [Peziza echinospora]|nr:polymerase/histidinol phosphatase-like protein [Peziza echinospora]